MSAVKQQYSSETISLAKRADIELNSKKLLIREIMELKDLRDKLHVNHEALCREYNAKDQTLQYLFQEIEAQALKKTRIMNEIKEEKKSEYEYIEKQTKKVDEASVVLNGLKNEEVAKTKQLKDEIGKIYEEREQFTRENARLQRHADQVEAADKNIKLDMLRRERELKESKEEFELYKASMEKDFAKINRIKNENATLLEKINRTEEKIEKERNSMNHEIAAKEAEIKTERDTYLSKENSVALRHELLDKREQDLKDTELELRAREVEAQKVLTRQQAQKVIDAG